MVSVEPAASKNQSPVPAGWENRGRSGLYRPVLVRTLQLLLAGAGAALAAGALAANQNWLDRHFLPLFFFPA